ncbi:tetratricopeptide repeat protein [Chryseobacterium indologenes]|uniref:tetratricopeptide repeat protein n=1 Tax=Chryseobacterium indologenes TaxID=253 RepID=UPI0040583B28
MTKLLLILSFLVTGSLMNAQFFSDQTLQQAVLQFDNAKTENDYDMLFSRFSEAKTSDKWQANYYAAATLYLKTNFLLNNSPNSPLGEPNETARKLAMQSLASEKNNGEVNLLLALIHFQKIRIKTAADPQKELKTVTSFMNKAETTLKNNPRLSFLKAEIAEKQGNKTEAIKFYQKAAKEFETSGTASSSPNWGKQLIGTN